MCHISPKRRQQLQKFYFIFKELMNRKLATDSHIKAWKDFCVILQVRSQIYMGGHIITGMFLVLTGGCNYNLSKKFLEEEEGPPNNDLAREYLPILTALFWSLSALRVVMFVVSLKYNKLAQYFIYLWVVFDAVEAFMPGKISLEKAVKCQTSNSLLLFL